MNSNYSDFQKENNLLAEDRRLRDVREFRELIAVWVERGKAEQLELPPLIPGAKKIVAETFKKFPFSANDPGALRDAILDLHRVLRSAEDICVRRVGQLQQQLDYIASATPEWFSSSTPKLHADEQGPRRLACLLNGSVVLKNLQSEIDCRWPEIARLLASDVVRAQVQQPTRGTTPLPASPEPQTISDFDARLT